MILVKRKRVILITDGQPIAGTILGNFTFTIPPNAKKASACVRRVSDQVVIRTLFVKKNYSVGPHTENWNGLDDDDLVPVVGVYEIIIITYDITAVWQGGYIGNTSASPTGGDHLRSFEFVRDISIHNGFLYTALGYNEVWSCQQKITIASPNRKYHFNYKEDKQGTNFNCNDGINVYWGGYEHSKAIQSFVFANRISDEIKVNFSAGTTLSFGSGTYRAISILNGDRNLIQISGMAVQSSGNYLFVCREAQNQIQVIDKTTGALVNTISMTAPKHAKIDNNGFLWVCRNVTTIEKYTINVDGSITSTGFTITSVSQVATMGINNASTSIAVADYSTQQVRFFNTSTGVEGTQLGTIGGYLSNSTVTDYKFCFKSVNENYPVSLAYNTNGDLYVLDFGNRRIQNYNSSNVYISNIMFLPAQYNTTVDGNNSNRIFNEGLEFEIDYSKAANDPLMWKLKRNWEASYNKNLYNGFERFKCVNTLLNGRTYARVAKLTGPGWYEVVELVNNGAVRSTGTTLPQRAIITKEGYLVINEGVGLQYPCTFTKYDFASFDVNGNPSWSTIPQLFATTPIVGTDNPVSNIQCEQLTTSSNNVIYFDQSLPENGVGFKYKLGAVGEGQNYYKWKAAKVTSTGFFGTTPDDGYFDIGNNVNYPGGFYAITGNVIVWSWHAEFFKSDGQANLYNMVDGTTGLFLLQFGKTSREIFEEAGAEGAGNALTGNLVTGSDGKMYLYHGDESYSSAYHRWVLNGTETIQYQTGIFPTINAVPIDNSVNLMSGLTGITELVEGVGGWSRSIAYAGSSITTGSFSYGKKRDLVLFNQAPGTLFAHRNLRTTTGALSNWSLFNGTVSFDYSTPNSNDGSAYLQILDNTGKIIVNLYVQSDGTTTWIKTNNQIIYGAITYNTRIVSRYYDKAQPIIITYNGTNIIVKYADFAPITITTPLEVGADFATPQKIKLIATKAVVGSAQPVISIVNLKFTEQGLL